MASSVSFSTHNSGRPSNVCRPRLRLVVTMILFACLATTSCARIVPRRVEAAPEATKPVSASSATLDLPALTLLPHSHELRAEDMRAAELEPRGVWIRASSDDDEEEDDSKSKSKSDDEEDTKTTSKSNRDEDEKATKTSDDDDRKATMTMSVRHTSSTEASATSSSSPLPQAFDGTFKKEFSAESDSNCPTFLNGILEDPSYKSCYPLSMMIQTSRGFWESQKRMPTIVEVLDATCAANVTYCSDYFSEAAKNLTREANCKSEYKSGDNMVKQFYTGLKGYEMVYKASCLQNPDDDMYCFATAVTNQTSATNSYFYYLPYNLTLPGGSVPSCNWCIEETMSIYHAAAADRTQLIANTYESAARQVNTICGADFVNGTLPDAEESFGITLTPPYWTTILVCLSAVLLAPSFL